MENASYVSCSYYKNVFSTLQYLKLQWCNNHDLLVYTVTGIDFME